ncbi:MAG: hypothetical protein LBG52_01655 [Candidatus Peribacteria bacterium]|nr:hypothetical protein [Candidatus Peribacteria bacterium]
MIKDATSKNKKQQSLDLQDIHNKVLYYFANTSKNPLAKNITQKASSSIKIEENDLYKVFYPEEIKETSLIYPSELQQKLEGIVKNRENRETILKNNLPYPNKILLYGEP